VTAAAAGERQWQQLGCVTANRHLGHQMAPACLPPTRSPLLTSTRRSTCAPDTITLRRSSPAQGHLFLAVVYWLRTALLTTHMPHSMRSRVCETIRCPFVCPSVCLSQYGPTAVGPSGRRYRSMLQQRRRSGSATLSAYVYARS